MSAPLKLSSTEVAQLGEFLKQLSFSTRHTGVRVDGYGNANVSVGDTVIEVAWDEERREYVLDDRVGR